MGNLMNQQDKPPLKGADVLKQLPKLREILRQMRLHPELLPHLVENPMTGEIIDVLDGETEALLDDLERAARFDIGRQR